MYKDTHLLFYIVSVLYSFCSTVVKVRESERIVLLDFIHRLVSQKIEE